MCRVGLLLRCGAGVAEGVETMRRILGVGLVTAMLVVGVAPAVSAAPPANACWGQATKVFAQAGEMGDHASNQANPRMGLRNLARALAEAGVIMDDSMAALGGFVATELGLTIDACT